MMLMRARSIIISASQFVHVFLDKITKIKILNPKIIWLKLASKATTLEDLINVGIND